MKKHTSVDDIFVLCGAKNVNVLLGGTILVKIKEKELSSCASQAVDPADVTVNRAVNNRNAIENIFPDSRGSSSPDDTVIDAAPADVTVQSGYNRNAIENVFLDSGGSSGPDDTVIDAAPAGVTVHRAVNNRNAIENVFPDSGGSSSPDDTVIDAAPKSERVGLALLCKNGAIMQLVQIITHKTTTCEIYSRALCLRMRQIAQLPHT